MVNALVDYLNAPGVVPLQRVLDNFDGDTLNERWTINNIVGTLTANMNDAVNGGVRLSISSTDNDVGSINFGDIKHYQPLCSFIANFKIATITSVQAFASLNNRSDSNIGSEHHVNVGVSTPLSTSFFYTRTGDGSTSNTATSVSIDTNYHTHQGTITSSALLYYIDDVLELLKTTNIPSDTLQPGFLVNTKSASARTMDINYMEAYNT